MSFVKIYTVSGREVQRYLDDGWELIDTTKELIGPSETQIIHHIGYPAKRKIDDLLKIINEYEKRGLKQKLFELVAEENGDNIEDISLNGGRVMEGKSKTAKFMSWHDSTVLGKQVTYYEKYDAYARDRL